MIFFQQLIVKIVAVGKRVKGNEKSSEITPTNFIFEAFKFLYLFVTSTRRNYELCWRQALAWVIGSPFC